MLWALNSVPLALCTVPIHENSCRALPLLHPVMHKEKNQSYWKNWNRHYRRPSNVHFAGDILIDEYFSNNTKPGKYQKRDRKDIKTPEMCHFPKNNYYTDWDKQCNCNWKSYANEQFTGGENRLNRSSIASTVISNPERLWNIS